MKIAVISDIHGNLEALEKALSMIEQQTVDEIICLGDIVGYGANPSECVDLVRRHCRFVLKGNHDEAVTHDNDMENFNPYAIHSILWTRSRLSDDQMVFLKNLPMQLTLEGLRFVHASPDESSEWDYVFNQHQAKKQFGFFQEPICFYGHTHIPAIFAEHLNAGEVFPDERFLVNVGSIGQPRDGNPQLSYGVFDFIGIGYESIRADYDLATAADKIRAAGLPTFLADRLLRGR